MQLLARIKAAFTSERWLQSSMRVLTGGSDSARQPFSYSQAVLYYRSWIYAAANLNAMAVASQPLRLYVRNRSTGTKLWKTRSTSHRTKAYFAGDTSELPSRYVMQKAAEYGDDYEVVTDNHPLLELLSKVNPYQNGFDATVLRVLYQELTGNAYVHPVIDKRTGIPSELWTMPSQYVEIIPGKSTLVDGYLYGASRENRKVFAADEVIHFKRPNPSDILYGMGKVEAAWGAAMMNAAMHEMDLSFFENKARPDYLMTIKTNASREEIERLEVQIDEKLRGKGRTGRFLTATADIDLKPMNFPPKDLGGREDIVEEIAAIFGVPVSMLKANDPNLASATVGFQSWKAISVLPLMRMDEETLNQNLVPLFGIEGDAFLAYDSPVVEDERFAFERRRSSVSAGVMTANEMRSREGLDVIDDPMADRLLINGQPLGGVPPMAVPMSYDAPRDEQVEPVSAPDELVDELPVTEVLAPATKALTDIETRPPQTVADNARRALDIRAQKPESQRGMTAVGIARARDLANRVSLSEDTIRRMLAYFERHEVDKQGETWDEQGKGWQAWNGWGGDDGFVWARRKVEQFNREREQKAARKSCDCCAKNSGGDPIFSVDMGLKDCGTGSGGFEPGNTCGGEEGVSSESSSARSLSADLGNASVDSEGVINLTGGEDEIRSSLKSLVTKWQGKSMTRSESQDMANQMRGSEVDTKDYRDAAASYTLTDGDSMLKMQSLNRQGKSFEESELEMLINLRANPGSNISTLSDEALKQRAKQRTEIVKKQIGTVTAQAQQKLPESMTVHRGMTATSEDSRKFIAGIKVGSTVEAGLMSTSMNASVAQDYTGDIRADRVLMKIKTNRGIVAQVDERNESQEGYLQEIVISPKRLRVISVNRVVASSELEQAGEGWGDLVIGGKKNTTTIVEMEAEYD